MAITKFTVLYVKTKSPSKMEDISNLAFSTLKSVHNLREVQYNEFQSYTRSKPIPRYILFAKEEARQKIEKSKEMLSKGIKYKFEDTLEGTFQAIETAERDTIEHYTFADPAYAILDTHQISPTEFIILLNRNPFIPIFNFLVMRKIASRISKVYTTCVMAVDDFKNINIEHLSYFENGTITKDLTVPYGHDLMGEFQKQTQIDIIDLLRKIDENVDVLMAPYDLSDYNAIMGKLLESKAFMERTGANGPNTDEMMQQDYKDLIDEINTNNINIQTVTARIMIDPLIHSRYFKFEAPKELEVYMKRAINNTEISSLY